MIKRFLMAAVAALFLASGAVQAQNQSRQVAAGEEQKKETAAVAPAPPAHPLLEVFKGKDCKARFIGNPGNIKLALRFVTDAKGVTQSYSSLQNVLYENYKTAALKSYDYGGRVGFKGEGEALVVKSKLGTTLVFTRGSAPNTLNMTSTYFYNGYTETNVMECTPL